MIIILAEASEASSQFSFFTFARAVLTLIPGYGS